MLFRLYELVFSTSGDLEVRRIYFMAVLISFCDRILDMPGAPVSPSNGEDKE